MGNILAFPKRSPPSLFEKRSPPENLFDLPFDVQCKILSGLPLKYLVQFSCASKQARELIDDPIFIRAHLKLINSLTDSRRVLILWWDPNLCRLKQCSLSSLLCAPTTETVDINYPPFKNPFTGVRVVGCCNGLVCIVFDGTKIILWNPSTRKSKIVPDLGIRVEEDKGLPVVTYLIFSWGFGYDKIEDDHKVVAVAYEADQGAATAMDGEVPKVKVKVKVYSTKKGIWKRIGDFQGGYPPLGVDGTFVNGKLHWSLEAEAGGDIVSLDLTTETYGRIEKPEQMKKPEIKCDEDSESLFEPVLEVYQEKLCLLCSVDNGHTDVWMMEIYGVTESWKMQFAILINNPGGISRPLCRSEDGEVLVSTGTKSVRYNPDNAAYVDIPFRDQNIEVYHAFPYTQSLVLPYSKEEKDAIEQRRRRRML
ncbi:F-box/kelch-repeat protein At3g23880-like [Coffea arabica]|uniref:F-box/kelch-repeat protein At3g23880-like n=1 Tax=Coffea arabica TaxID=13443 RepID=A0A6P6WTC0_COFAR|nr:F-box/kelch-repeat protein At3g23880-like isoform X2 [Coffea arabica]